MHLVSALSQLERASKTTHVYSGPRPIHFVADLPWRITLYEQILQMCASTTRYQQHFENGRCVTSDNFIQNSWTIIETTFYHNRNALFMTCLMTIPWKFIENAINIHKNILNNTIENSKKMTIYKICRFYENTINL